MKKLFLHVCALATLSLTSCIYNETTDEFETTWLFWALLIALVFIIIMGSAQSKKNEEDKQERDRKLAEASERLNVSAEVTGVNNHYKFIVDDVAKNIIYINASLEKKTIPYSQVMAVEVEEDNTIVSSKSLGRTIGGAIVGNIVAGRAGMIVGGLSGDSKQKKKVSNVSVTIKLRDMSNPSMKIVCFDVERETGTKNPIKPDDSLFGPAYAKGATDAQKIAELIGIIIDQNDKAAQPTTEEPSSISDELQKLADLKQQGLITDDEFTALKSKLLNE